MAVVVMGYLLYLVLGTLIFRRLTAMMFTVIYVACFFIIGFAQYAFRVRRNPENPWNQLWDHIDRSRWWFVQGLGLIRALWFPLTIPALFFHFAREMLTGRHLFASEEVEELAFEVLYDGGDKIMPDFLQRKLDSRPEILAPAIQLLLEMKLLILHRGRSKRALLRTIAGKELLEHVPHSSKTDSKGNGYPKWV